jgi:hypothetical protein
MSRAARGGGRGAPRGQRLCGSALTRETPLFVSRRDAMIHHRDIEIAEIIPSSSQEMAWLRLRALCALVVTTCAKRSQFFDFGLRIADCGLDTELGRDARPAVPCLRPTRADCAKRTQFGPSAREWARAAGAVEGEMCETNPISRVPQGPAGAIAQNKAKLGQDGTSGGRCIREADYTKRSQSSRLPIGDRLAAGRLPRAVPPPARADQLRKTNPICPLRTGPPLGPIVQNEPNSRQSRVGRGLGDEGRTCKTKPIREKFEV